MFVKKLNLLGVCLDNLNLDEVIEKIGEFLSVAKSPLTPLLQSGEEEGVSFARRGGGQHYVVLPYAAFLVEAQQDEEFRKILNEADLSLADGIGPVIASYLCGQSHIKGRVMGVDLVWALVAKFGAEYSFFFFGAREGVAPEAAEKITESCLQAETGLALKGGLQARRRQVDAKIVGTLNGYVSDEEAIAAINASGAEILLVGLGMPKQEKWIYNNLRKMPAVRLAVGVGGSFDFISGRTRRAPRFVQKMGLEWLWRLFTQPSRWRKTWRSVVVFSWLVLKSTFQHS